MENFSLLGVVTAWPEQVQLAANMAVFAKFGKLSSMNVAFVLTGTLLLWAATTWLKRRVGSRGA